MLHFKGSPPKIKMTRKQYEKTLKKSQNSEDYFCFKDIDQDCPAVYYINGGIYYTKAASSFCNTELVKTKEKLENLQLDYDILQKKYDMLLMKYNGINSEDSY